MDGKQLPVPRHFHRYEAPRNPQQLTLPLPDWVVCEDKEGISNDGKRWAKCTYRVDDDVLFRLHGVRTHSVQTKVGDKSSSPVLSCSALSSSALPGGQEQREHTASAGAAAVLEEKAEHTASAGAAAVLEEKAEHTTSAGAAAVLEEKAEHTASARAAAALEGQGTEQEPPVAEDPDPAVAASDVHWEEGFQTVLKFLWGTGMFSACTAMQDRVDEDTPWKRLHLATLCYGQHVKRTTSPPVNAWTRSPSSPMTFGRNGRPPASRSPWSHEAESRRELPARAHVVPCRSRKRPRVD